MRLLFLASLALGAQIADYPDDTVAGIPVNYTEAKAGSYILPDLLGGARDRKAWEKRRRPELVRLLEREQFGRAPAAPKKLDYTITDAGTPAFEGKAKRKQITLYLGPGRTVPVDVLLYTPAKGGGRAPVLLNVSFTANANVVADPGVKAGTVWNREKKRVPAAQARAFGRVKVEPFLEAGIGFATVYYGDIDPDFAGGRKHGVRAPFAEPAADEWGTVSAWAWGLSRVLDYLEKDGDVDGKRVALTGVSRLGKTVLWTGARDARFAAVIASCSGEGGAALSRRNYGETIAHLTAPARYGYQFAGNYSKFAANPGQAPFDAHMLVALIAPRPLLLQTGNTDKWSDPKGEYLAARAAAPVYRLFGKSVPEEAEVPPAGRLSGGTLSYYMHAGGHGMVPGDWDIFLQFLKAHL